MGQNAFRSFTRGIERLTPPVPTITKFLQAEQPNALFVVGFVQSNNHEIEYVKAAKALGIPSIVAIASWDNLTTKGTYHLYPDYSLVWNQAQVEEAVGLHSVPRDSLRLTGGPVFDKWFDLQPTMDYASLCASLELDAERPFVLYLGSSKQMAVDEDRFFTQMIEASSPADGCPSADCGTSAPTQCRYLGAIGFGGCGGVT